MRTLAIALLVAVFSGTSTHGVTFDFEGEAATALPRNGAFGTLTIIKPEVTATFTRPGSNFDVIDTADIVCCGGFPLSFGDRALDPFVDETDATPFIIDFSKPISSALIDLGDFGGDSPEELIVEAFGSPGATGSLIDSETLSLPTPPNTFTFANLSVSGSSIRSLRVIGGTTSFPNSVFLDNLTVDIAVPEPTTAVLGLMGIAGLASRRRKAA